MADNLKCGINKCQKIFSVDLEHLRTCRNLSVLDLSYNRIEDPLIIDVLADMDDLKGI